MNTNPIFQVLVVGAGTSLNTAGNTIDQLTTGQLGVFNADTNLAFTNMAAIPERFYFGLGALDVAGNKDVKKSTGEAILKKYVKTVTSKNYDAPVAQVSTVTMTGYTPTAETSYSLGIEFRSGATYQRDGYTLPRKTFVVDTADVAPSLANLIIAFANKINADPEDIVTATYTGTTLVLTFASTPKVGNVAGINPNYVYLRNFTGVVSLKEGFEGTPCTVAISTAAVYEQGSGYDIQREEYVAAGWTGNPGLYRDADLAGLFRSANFAPLAVAGTNYWVMRLNYNMPSNSGGFLSYENQVETVIAIPDSASYKTLISALEVMNAAFVAGGATGILESYTP